MLLNERDGISDKVDWGDFGCIIVDYFSVNRWTDTFRTRYRFKPLKSRYRQPIGYIWRRKQMEEVRDLHQGFEPLRYFMRVRWATENLQEFTL